MALFKISRRNSWRDGRRLVAVGAGGRAALAADITLGIVYVGREMISAGIKHMRSQ